jgi:hypothetical protein
LGDGKADGTLYAPNGCVEFMVRRDADAGTRLGITHEMVRGEWGWYLEERNGRDKRGYYYILNAGMVKK